MGVACYIISLAVISTLGDHLQKILKLENLGAFFLNRNRLLRGNFAIFENDVFARNEIPDDGYTDRKCFSDLHIHSSEINQYAENGLVHQQCTTKTKYKQREFDAFVSAVAGIEYKAIAEIECNDVGEHESEDVRDLVVHLHFKQEQECVLDAC